MRYLLIRHGKTDANRLTRAAFGKQGAPLNKLGISQAKNLHKQLLVYGFDLATEPVAASQLLRTSQTAKHAGLQIINTYSSLNEVKTPDPQHTQKLIEKNTTARSHKSCKKYFGQAAQRTNMGNSWSGDYRHYARAGQTRSRCIHS